MDLCNVHFTIGEKQILKKHTCVEQHAFWDDPLVFLTPERRPKHGTTGPILGAHFFELGPPLFTRKQRIPARSSAEAELGAAALGASESKGIVSLLRDLGSETRPVSAIDSKATEHIFHRQGIGRLKHIDVAFLWMQDEIRSKLWGPNCSAKQ